MAKKLMTTLAIGAIGAAVGMMVTPNLDRKTQRALKKASRRMIDAAGESMGWFRIPRCRELWWRS